MSSGVRRYRPTRCGMISLDLALLLAELAGLTCLALGLLVGGIHGQLVIRLLPLAVAARIRVITFTQGEE